MITIEGAGLAGRVLHAELSCAGLAATLADRAAFPRSKVCGGVLQKPSWDYLRGRFSPGVNARAITHITHFWRGRKMGRMELSPPAVFVSRLELDAGLSSDAPAFGGLTQDSSFSLTVNAKGARSGAGGWIGFETREPSPARDLEMHYGRGICLGISPTPENDSHVAFIVKRGRFGSIEDLRLLLRKELGLGILGPLKGTARIRYGYFPDPLAVGDAKMSTFPFLGFGMKHAIESARLLAACIREGDWTRYALLHRRRFARQRFLSFVIGRIYDSPFQGLLKPFVSVPALFDLAYRAVHA